MYGFFDGGICVGLMGLRELSDYVHLHHLYIDDLVVKEGQRGNGIGAKLLHFAEDLARQKKCSGLRLCAGIDNAAGIRFYEREKWLNRALVYKKKVID